MTERRQEGEDVDLVFPAINRNGSSGGLSGSVQQQRSGTYGKSLHIPKHPGSPLYSLNTMGLLNAQRTRQKMEKDAQMLANRIALLK